ncbi:hypothetical protein [Cohnella faecalis]|nr:hypothetical protein [Cohnella faecalis]
MRKNSIVLHPLPRAGEIAEEVDADPRAVTSARLRTGFLSGWL